MVLLQDKRQQRVGRLVSRPVPQQRTLMFAGVFAIEPVRCAEREANTALLGTFRGGSTFVRHLEKHRPTMHREGSGPKPRLQEDPGNKSLYPLAASDCARRLDRPEGHKPMEPNQGRPQGQTRYVVFTAWFKLLWFGE